MQETTINRKAEKFRAFILENKIDFFGTEEKGDELKTVIFRTELEVSGQRMPLLIFTDESIYTVIKIRVVPYATKDGSKEKIAGHLDALNNSYKAFKYFINADGDIVLDIAMPCDSEFFDPRIVTALIEIALKHLTEEYAAFMKLVWNSEEKESEK